jgi:hypothetical protein
MTAAHLLLSIAIAFADTSVSIRFVTDQAEAAIAILDAHAARGEAGAAEWRRLVESEGYRRLHRREEAMGRGFTDSSFAAFLREDSMARRAPALRATLHRWTTVDFRSLGARVLEWLPPGARIRARVYPLVKPRTNSFVFELATDPAIMLFLDPAVPAERFANTAAHELHHIGLGAACAEEPTEGLAEGLRQVLRWSGAFGEGFAMLAAAGGPGGHPHAVSSPEEHAEWDASVARFDQDLAELDRFFLNVLETRAGGEDSVTARARTFYGTTQGPWYTVGWRMAATVVEEFGRDRFVSVMCSPGAFLRLYDEAAVRRESRTGQRMARWSPALLTRLP